MEPQDDRRSQARRRAPGGNASEAGGSGWSWRICSVFGIPIRIHVTFLLILAWAGLGATKSGGSAPFAIFFVLLLFACVVLHELGHALMARRFGVRTREIVLYPIGGIARLESMPSGKAELLIAIAGPLVNVGLAALLAVVMLLGRIPWPEFDEFLMTMTGGKVLPALLLANIILFAFNLLPAFPMDGGRVLRAALTFWMAEEKATDIAASVGQAMAMLFGAWGLLTGHFFLIFIAFFVFLGAGQEAAFYRQRAAVRDHAAREAMITQFETLSPEDSLARAAEALIATHQQDFPVVQPDGGILGILSRAALLKGLASQGTSGSVESVMEQEVRIVDPETPLKEVLQELQAKPSSAILVGTGGELEGMITLENLIEFIEVERALPHAEERLERRSVRMASAKGAAAERYPAAGA
jgi:Zn-dependent protease/predicted transcriptional regulator